MSVFYSEDFSDQLRMGDVIANIPSILPYSDKIDNMLNNKYSISIDSTNCIVMSPCCSIENNLLCLVPLEKIPDRWIENPNFVSDFTCINYMIAPRFAAAHKWDRLSEEQQRELEAEGISYIYLEYFVYQGHEQLPSYTVKYKRNSIETNFYCIDFRKIFSINSSDITRGAAPPRSKILQLSIVSRDQLRDKLLNYFSRKPAEDYVI